MLKRGLGTDPPSVTVVEIDDPTSAGEGIELIDLDAVQLASAPFRARRVVVRLGRRGRRSPVDEPPRPDADEDPARSGGLRHLRPRDEGDRERTAHPSRPDAGRRSRRRRSCSFPSPGTRASRSCSRRQDLREHLNARRREGELRLPRGVEILQADAAMVRRLFDWGKRLVERGRTPARAVQRPDGGARRGPGRDGRDASFDPRCDQGASSLPAPTRRASFPVLVVKTAEDYALSHAARSRLRDRPVPGRRRERANPGVRVQGRHGRDAGGLSDPAQAAPRAPGAAGGDSRIDHGLGRGARLGVSGTSASSRAPTRTASASCRRTRCDESPTWPGVSLFGQLSTDDRALLGERSFDTVCRDRDVRAVSSRDRARYAPPAGGPKCSVPAPSPESSWSVSSPSPAPPSSRRTPGEHDPADIDEGLPEEGALLALRGPQLPDAAVLRRHAPAHGVLDGRRRLRRAARPARRLPVRAGRGDHARTAGSR